MAWGITMFKRNHILNHDVRIRGFLLTLSTVLILKAFRGYKKIPISLGFLLIGSSFFTPEIVNGYY